MLAGLSARATGRPVKYIEDRIDNITACDNHGSDRTYDVELALDSNYRMTALRYKVVDDYRGLFPVRWPRHARQRLFADGRAVQDPCGGRRNLRGLHQQMPARRLPRLRLGSDQLPHRADRRCRSRRAKSRSDSASGATTFIQPDEFPYQIPTGNHTTTAITLAPSIWRCKCLITGAWRDKQQLMRTQGRYVGIGVASCQEKGVFSATEFWMLNRAPGFALTSSPESASIKIDATGKAVISLHAPCCGNSPETVAAMVLAEQLSMDPADISVTYSDSDHGLPGTGPGGNRYTVMIAGAP